MKKLLLILCLLISAAGFAQEQKIIIDASGRKVIRNIVPPSPPPVKQPLPAGERAALKATIQEELDHEDTVLIEDVPAFKWTYGCTATAAGMLIGYYDRNGYPNLYTGEVSSGICPLTDQPWVDRWGTGSPGLVSFVASKKGVDGLETNGHIDDFYTSYLSEGDPYYGKWTPHCNPGEGNCLADFMGTSQWYPNDLQFLDGGSSYDTYNTIGTLNAGLKWYSSTDFGDCAYGVKLFIESKGYTVEFYGNTRRFDQEDYDEKGWEGCRFSEFQSEIDAGRPVLFHLFGHSMLGIGYNATLNKVFFHDTWDRKVHSMDWGGYYANMIMRDFSFIRLAPSTDTTVTVDITSNLAISDYAVEPFGAFQVNANEAIPLTATTSEDNNESDIVDARFIGWETTGAVSVADSTASETTFTCTGSGGTINAVYEELKNFNITKFSASTGSPGRDYIKLDVYKPFDSGISTGKIIIDDFEYDFANVPANGVLKEGPLLIKNQKSFQLYLKKQTIDMFDTTDGLWVELQADGVVYRRDFKHWQLDHSVTWKSTQEVTGTNMNLSKFKAKYIIKRYDSKFFLNMKGTGLDGFTGTPTISLDTSSWDLSVTPTVKSKTLYKQTDNPKYSLVVDPAKGKWGMNLKEQTTMDSDQTIPGHPSEGSTTVTVTITDGTDTATVDVPCTVKQKIKTM